MPFSRNAAVAAGVATMGVSLLGPWAAKALLYSVRTKTLGPLIRFGVQAAPESSFTVVRAALPGMATYIVVGGTMDPHSQDELARVASSIPDGAGIVTINAPQTVGFGIDDRLVVGTGAYTYKRSLEAGVAAVTAALVAVPEGQAVCVIGISQGASLVTVALQRLAVQGARLALVEAVLVADPNTPGTGLASKASARLPGMPSPINVADMPVPTTIVNSNGDTWGPNVPHGWGEMLFYVLPSLLWNHSKGNTAAEQARWAHTATTTQLGRNTTMVVLHPQTPSGAAMNPWLYALDLLANENRLPRLKGHVYERLNRALNRAVPVGETGRKI